MDCIATSLAPAWPRETKPASAASRPAASPFPLKRLLVLSDLSPAGDNAAWRGGLLAAEHRAWVHLMHVRPWAARDGASQRRLEATAWHLQERLKVAVLAQAVPGASRRELADATAQADLVVVAAPSGIALRWAVHAWTPQRVLRSYQRPTLAVRRPACVPYQRVLVGIHEARQAANCIATAAGMAGGPHAQLLRHGVLDEALVANIRMRDELETDSLARHVEGRVRNLADAVGRGRMQEVPAIAFTSSADMLLAQEKALFAELVVSSERPSLASALLAHSWADTLWLPGSLSEPPQANSFQARSAHLMPICTDARREAP